MNQQAYARNYNPITIDIDAVIDGGDIEAIAVALQGLLGPIALESDGITYKWNLGGASVTRNKIIATIFQADPDVNDVVLNTPASNVVLAEGELPVLGTLTLTAA